MAFNGHYHHPQKIQLSSDHIPVVCVGSPAELNWSDADSSISRGIMCVELEGSKVKCTRIPTNLPRFFNSPNPEATDRDFVRNLELEKKRNTGNTRVHDKHTVIGGANIKKAIRGYVEETTAANQDGRRTLSELGLTLYYKGKEKGGE